MAMRDLEHVAATSLDEAVRLSAERGKKAAIIAGGTDLLGALKDNIHPSYPELLVDIKPIEALRTVKEGKNRLHIGALTTISEVARHQIIQEKYRVLAQAARVVASPQIRNMGTVGGNLCQEPRCWYYRAPDNRFHCLRKGGEQCGAVLGENRYHSIFGAVQTCMPSCATNCPAHVPIPAYLEKIRAGKIEQATQLLLDHNPMPAITGRVCPHFCQAHCNRTEFDEPVATRAIERYLGDRVLDNPAAFMRAPKTQSKRKVAIIGAGPAGLAAAYYLRKAGHRVTLFDRMPEAGGMLRYFIPTYRLPKSVVEKQIQAFAQMGIEFVLNTAIGREAATLKRLRKDYDGVFLATGAWRQKTLRMENEELLLSGADFLIEIQRGRRQAPGKKVLVIGGGSVAVDVAISALRLGAEDVTMACLEAREIMPAFPEDIEQAFEEKIKLLPSWGPHRILTRGGKITGMELKRCTSVFDSGGRFRPTYDPSTKMTVKADCVLSAIGQVPELGGVERLLKTERGLIVAHEDTQATNLPGVFAGGDVVTGASTVIAGIAAGRRAALAIDAAFRGGKVKAGAGERGAVETGVEVNVAALAKTKAARSDKRAPSTRTIDAEDVSTLDLGAVQVEASRCVNCGCVAVNASDLAPALLALDAKIRTTKKTVAAEDFFAAGLMSTTQLEPGELITAIEVPAPPSKSVQSYLKFRIRNAIDFPIVGLATVFSTTRGKVTDARVALGAVAPVPLRVREVEKFLVGKALDEETAEAAAAIAVRGVQPLNGNRFKIQIVKALLRKAILDAAKGRAA
jgi:NADPH-dependent glutamate synthase beta subunit-like oxidoreductase/CO/xanthine dehydrogenase FAD-binding subunit